MFKPTSPQLDLPGLEKTLLKYWEDHNVVQKYLTKNANSKKYWSFLDGPITANNPMGVHHAWGRTFKDLWQRYYNMKGYRERFQNGFDCQGLWVEVEVEKELGIRTKKDIENLVPGNKAASIAKFVELCKTRVLKFSQIQTQQSIRLGYFMDWDHSYYTMSDKNNYTIWHFLKVCHDRGWIYKGTDSVPWCPRCETAISQHEMLTEDYKEIVHDSIIFELPIVGREKEYLLVWTTTPWTIPANIAVAIDEKLDYSLVQGDTGDFYWVAKDLVEKVFKKKYEKIIKIVKGKQLLGLHYRGPFDDLEAVKKVAQENKSTFHSVVATDDKILPISKEEGTGLVHTAVSAGVEDYKLGKKLGLPMIPVIADNADYLPSLGFLTGKNAKKNPHLILDYLVEKDKQGENWVFEIEKYKHRYPACWRCKTELVWKVTDEWYVAMDKPSKLKVNKTLREMMIEVAKKINWLPAFGLDRELDWLKNMHDWLISKKNRYWGLCLPIYECLKCKTFEVVGSREELKEKAVEGWQEFEGHSPHKPYIDGVKIRCSNCHQLTSRIEPVGNPWLDAGTVPFSTIAENNQGEPLYKKDRQEWQKWFPADFITESFPGQFKNWFYSLIAMSTVLENTNPFKTVLGFATLLGEDGRAMHKSWGNAIEFNEGADKIGVDVMRWMYATHNPEQNLLFGYKKADEVRRKFHLILWNVYNFFVAYANVDKYPKFLARGHLAALQGDTLQGKNVLDRWIRSRLNQTIQIVTNSLDKYDEFTASLSIEDFVSDLSTWYLRRSRDRVGPTVEASPDKKACYQTLYYTLVTLAKLLAPFTPFIAEEIYKNLTGEESVHLADWPELEDGRLKIEDRKIIEQMNLVRKICELGHAERKKLSIKVRQPLQKFKIQSIRQAQDKSSKFKINEELVKLIKDELNVKQIELKPGSGELSVKLDATITPELRAEGEARELIRQIQVLRKESGCRLNQYIDITLPENACRDFANYIKRETLAKKILWGDHLQISTR